MSALQDLERQLTRAVDAGAAADPARVRSGVSATLADGRRRRRWLRSGRLFAGILVAGGLATGALAASGVFRVAPETEGAYLPMVGDEGAGVPASPVRVLPLRVADPLGGPPWVIRTFTTNRQAACAQVGQLYRGQFGRVERDARNQPVFRRIGIHIGETARCTNAVQPETRLPVLRGLRSTYVRGGSTSPARCSSAIGRAGDCPIDAVTVVRFGLLGPAARRAWFVRSDGTRSRPQRLAPSSGGAYLFAERADPKPWREYQAIQAHIQRKVDERFPPLRDYDHATEAARRAADRALSAKVRYVSTLYRQAFARGGYAQTPVTRLSRDGIDAEFTGARVIRAAGAGVTPGGLPGVTPVRDDLPPTLPAKVTVEYATRRQAIHVRFDAPVALDRYARAYRVDVRGPRSPSCDRVLPAGTGWVSRAPKRGQPLRVTVKPIGPNAGSERRGWCPGASYTVRVVHHSGTTPGGRDRPVGSARFVGR